jgi:hypothetical protein
MRTIPISRKFLAVGIILLFVGVAVAPRINSSVEKTTSTKDLVEVTTRACGVQNLGNTTVKLTEEQYDNLKQYLIDFRARLNQTTCREEAVPLFMNAVMELDKYGLLPRGLSVEQVQKLVLGRYQSPRVERFLGKLLRCPSESTSGYENDLCFVAGRTNFTVSQGPLLGIRQAVSIFASNYFHSHPRNNTLYWVVYGFFLLQFALSLLGIGNFLSNLVPISLFSTIGFGCGLYNGYYFIGVIPASGWIYGLGLRGVTQCSGYIVGNLTIGSHSDYMPIIFWVYLMNFYPGILGFTGIKIDLPKFDSFYLGFALKMKIMVVQ